MKYWNLVRSSKKETMTTQQTYYLDDNDVDYVMDRLLTFQNKYFSEIPITDSPYKSFIYNIPRDIIDASDYYSNLGTPDCLDPLFWFYILTTGPDLKDSMSKWVTLVSDYINDTLTDRDIDDISDMSNRYDGTYLDNNDDDD